MKDIKLDVVEIKKPDEMNFILGQTHFIKSLEDLYEAIINTVPDSKFGIAFCEASGACKVRCLGNDKELEKIASNNALKIGAGHSFIIFMKNCYPINILNRIKNVYEVCTIFCATANPTKVIIAEAKQGKYLGRGILGVIDGFIPKGIENSDDIKWRKEFLRTIRYKL
jgi:adenosine/AMP kinase